MRDVEQVSPQWLSDSEKNDRKFMIASHKGTPGCRFLSSESDTGKISQNCSSVELMIH